MRSGQDDAKQLPLAAGGVGVGVAAGGPSVNSSVRFRRLCCDSLGLRVGAVLRTHLTLEIASRSIRLNCASGERADAADDDEHMIELTAATCAHARSM